MNQDNRILHLYQQGKSLRQIGKELGLSHTAIRKRLAKLETGVETISQAGNHEVESFSNLNGNLALGDNQQVIPSGDNQTCPDCGSQEVWECIHGAIWCAACSPPKAPELVKTG